MSNQETRETILLYQMDTLITFQLNSVSWVIKEEFAQLDTFPPNPNADFFFSFAMLEVKIDYVPRQGTKTSLQRLRAHAPGEGKALVTSLTLLSAYRRPS